VGGPGLIDSASVTKSGSAIRLPACMPSPAAARGTTLMSIMLTMVQRISISGSLCLLGNANLISMMVSMASNSCRRYKLLALMFHRQQRSSTDSTSPSRQLSVQPTTPPAYPFTDRSIFPVAAKLVGLQNPRNCSFCVNLLIEVDDWLIARGVR
jgi:hypothetical protein